MHQRFNILFLALLTAIFFVACDDPRTYDHFEHVNTTEWSSDDVLMFDVSRQWAGDYVMALGVRGTTSYPYRNLTVIVETTTLPRREVHRDTVNCMINDDLGRPIGQQGISSNDCHASIRSLQLHDGDSLHISVRHIMQRQDLPGINEVGIRLEKH